MFALDSDIARQTPEPSRAEAAPKREAEKQNQASQAYQQLSEFLHVLPNVVS